MPTTFLCNVASSSQQPKERVYTYERDIICLPHSFAGKLIKIPRNRDALSESGLVGKMTLSSNMTEDELFSEIRSVFRGPMGGSADFPFQVLQPTGGSSRSLTVPAVSSTFRWTAAAIAWKSTKTPIYILAQDNLQVSDIHDVHLAYTTMPRESTPCSDL